MFAVHWAHEGRRGTPRVKASLEDAVTVLRRFVVLGFENVRVAECDEQGGVIRFLPASEVPLIPVPLMAECPGRSR